MNQHPGVGKTYLLQRILKAISNLGFEVVSGSPAEHQLILQREDLPSKPEEVCF